MIDPILNFLSALALIFTNLPLPFQSLIAVVSVFAAVVIIVRILRAF